MFLCNNLSNTTVIHQYLIFLFLIVIFVVTISNSLYEFLKRHLILIIVSFFFISFIYLSKSSGVLLCRLLVVCEENFKMLKGYHGDSTIFHRDILKFYLFQ